MAEEKSASAGFDIGKFVKDGLKGGVKKVALSGGKYVLGRALVAAGVNPDLLKSTDQKILDELGVLEGMMAEVQSTLSDLSAEMRSLTREVEASIQAEGLKPPMETIDRHMVRLCNLFNDGSRDCFRLSLYQSPYDGAKLAAAGWTPPTEEKLRDFAESVKREVEDAMTSIRAKLLGTASDPGYLDTLTDTVILKLDARKGNVVDWYRYLEQRFLEFATMLLYGMVLKVNSVSYLEDDPTTDATEAEIWLRDTYRPLIQSVVSNFQGAVERLVLSRYQPVVQAAEPDFVAPADLDWILTRLDLLAWMLTSEDVADAEPGILLRRFLRSSQVTEKGGPELRPSSAYLPSTGELVGVPGPYSGETNGARMGHWYRCADLLESDGYLTLAPREKSDIRVARYRWTWPAQKPAPGAAVGSGLFTGVVARRVDKRTLGEAAADSPTTVLVAAHTDARPILDNLSFAPVETVAAPKAAGPVALWEQEAFVDPKNDQDADELLKEVKAVSQCKTAPYEAKLSIKVEAYQRFMVGKGPARYKFKLKRNVFYAGEAADVNVIAGGRLKLRLPLDRKYNSPVPSERWRTPEVSLEADVKALSFPSPDKNNDRDDDSIKVLRTEKFTNVRGTVDKDEERTIKDRFTLTGNQFNEVQWRLYLTALRQHTTGGPNISKSTLAQAEHQISYFRYAWDQPRLLT